MFEEILDFLDWEGGILGGDHRVWRCGFGGRGFDTRGSLFVILGLRFLRPGRLPGGGHYRLLRSLRDRLRRMIRM